MNNVRLDWNDFTSGRTRECFCVGTTAPGKFDDFAAEAAALAYQAVRTSFRDPGNEQVVISW